MKTSFYIASLKAVLQRFAPISTTLSWRDRWRASLGALCGLMSASWISYLLFGHASMPLLIAPMGASAALIFILPSSPLAQPWAVVFGNSISALVGVACIHLFQAHAAVAALAVTLAILAMFITHSLHPPGGAIALLAVLGDSNISSLSWHYALAPVALQSLCLVVCALAYHKLHTISYPHTDSKQSNLHRTGDQVISARLGVSDADLDAVLEQQGTMLDITRADLQSLISQVEIQVHQRHHGTIRCKDIMSQHLVTVEFETSLEQCWQLLRTHKIGSLPVVTAEQNIIGVISLIDFLKHAGLDVYHDFDLRLRQVLDQARALSGSEVSVAGHIMSGQPITASSESNILELVPLFSDHGLHSVPIVDASKRLCGIVTQSDLIAALYQLQISALRTH
ncbi:HPP family protein [Undibacterium cyanobacteriorum]|uniref:HPP family protein n=1 Tax=Undibacterium cyanobacteriorum TaxID=3073561 RepID=A0ABY9RI15_9BURK|nr:HPP family protein [Undibacterium sp. 20NA77.5]WMW80319.1 HPP family protein [Undibacterium sp. 20NA77.5]